MLIQGRNLRFSISAIYLESGQIQDNAILSSPQHTLKIRRCVFYTSNPPNAYPNILINTLYHDKETTPIATYAMWLTQWNTLQKPSSSMPHAYRVSDTNCTHAFDPYRRDCRMTLISKISFWYCKYSLCYDNITSNLQVLGLPQYFVALKYVWSLLGLNSTIFILLIWGLSLTIVLVKTWGTSFGGSPVGRTRSPFSVLCTCVSGGFLFISALGGCCDG